MYHFISDRKDLYVLHLIFYILSLHMSAMCLVNANND